MSDKKSKTGLHYIRNLYNITLDDLGEKVLGVGKATVSKYESGKIPISKDKLKQLSEYFDINEEYFQKELTEADKVIIQKNKLRWEINFVLYKAKRAKGNNALSEDLKNEFDELLEIERQLEANGLKELLNKKINTVAENSIPEHIKGLGNSMYVESNIRVYETIIRFLDIYERLEYRIIDKIMDVINYGYSTNSIEEIIEKRELTENDYIIKVVKFIREIDKRWDKCGTVKIKGFEPD